MANTGAVFPATIAEITEGTKAWINPNNATANDTTLASVMIADDSAP